MTDDKREPTKGELQDWRAAHDRMKAELAAIKARILAEPARMAALGIKDRHELEKLSEDALHAYGVGTGLVEPPGWPVVPGSKLPTDGDTMCAAAKAAYAALIPFIKQGANPFDLFAAVMNVALRPIMAAPSPEERALYYELAIKILGNVPLEKAPTLRGGHALELEPRRSVERKRNH